MNTDRKDNLNFGAKAEIKRKVLDNERKGSLGWIISGETNAHIRSE
jgi:hypothetical protein